MTRAAQLMIAYLGTMVALGFLSMAVAHATGELRMPWLWCDAMHLCGEGHL